MTSDLSAPFDLDLSVPDNSEYDKGRSVAVQALWLLFGARLVESRLLPISSLKCRILRLFGAKIGEGVYLKPGVRIKFPWYLTIGDHCWIGEDAWIDNLTHVKIGSHVCVSQGAYLCTGNHDWSSYNMKLFAQSIELRDGCWVGARSVLCPGVVMGEGSIAAVGSIVSKSIPPMEVWSGNPASFSRRRRMCPRTESTSRSL